MPVCPVWNSAGTPELLQHLVQRVVRGSLGSNACRLGWNLNPRTPCSLDQAPGPGDGGLARVRVDRAERDEHVGVRGGLVGDLLAGQRRVPGPGGRVDGEDHGGHAPGRGSARRSRPASGCGPGRRGSTCAEASSSSWSRAKQPWPSCSTCTCTSMASSASRSRAGHGSSGFRSGQVRCGPWRRAGRSARRRGRRPARPGRSPPARRRRRRTSSAAELRGQLRRRRRSRHHASVGGPRCSRTCAQAARRRRRGAG